jgi:methyl-accepting chemotaxis protein
MVRLILRHVWGGSIALRVFAAPLGILAVTAAVLFLADRQAEHALRAIDEIHERADRQRQQIGDLAAGAYVTHSNVSRHLSLTGSGIEDAKLAAMRNDIAAGLAKARQLIAAMQAAAGEPQQRAAVDQISRLLDAYATSVDELNTMALIERLMAIPLMPQVDEKFMTLASRVAELQAQIGAAAERATQATREESAATRVRLRLAIGAALLLMLGATVWIARSITKPLSDLTAAMRALAAGRLDIAIAGTERKNEMGEMARALQVFQESAARVAALEAERDSQRAASEAEKRQAIHGLANLFEEQVRQVLETVAAGTAQLRGSAVELLERARGAEAQAGAVSSATVQAGANVRSAADSAGTLSGSIGEIGEQVNRSFEIARDAVRQVEATNTDVTGLSEAAERIGTVVALIDDIASQTNLLALNATIEAARAGEAGKGFAVVASEVKSLANQTAQATRNITEQIAGMQQATSRAVAAVQGIGGTVSTIDQIIAQIAEAMARQSQATGDIARNLDEAAAGTDAVTRTITEVSQSATRTGAAADEVLKASELLDEQTATLTHAVDGFLGRLRAG